MKKEGENIFTSFLNALDVKHTETFSNRFYQVHPHKNDLFGISQMLANYKIENRSFRVNDKAKDISLLQIPFLANVKNSLVTVIKKTEDEISYIYNGNKVSVRIEEFINTWSGVVLLAKKSDKSLEPNYNENKKSERIKLLHKYILFLFIFIIIFFPNQQLYENIWLCILFLTNIISTYLCFLLVQGQINRDNDLVDKICFLFKKSDCNNILESEASKLWGIWSWSEIGLSYFFSNTIIILFFPHLITFLVLTGVCALPYTLWSIFYQKCIAKQWCPLCLAVQGVLLLMFLINLINGFIQIPHYSLNSILTAGCVYIMPFLISNLLIPKIIIENKYDKLIQELNSIKASEKVFTTLLEQQPYSSIDKSTSKILFGNPNAKDLITVITNPHCNPCARMHKRIQYLLEISGDQVCIQYIFTSFNKELENSALYMIAAYLNTTSNSELLKIYTDWFNKGKNNRFKYYKKFSLKEPDILNEYKSHKEWYKNTIYGATPIILFNGYELPENYRMEDIVYLIDAG